jgi:hypothetical protein
LRAQRDEFAYERQEITADIERQLRVKHGPNRGGSFRSPESYTIFSLLEELLAKLAAYEHKPVVADTDKAKEAPKPNSGAPGKPGQQQQK